MTRRMMTRWTQHDCNTRQHGHLALGLYHGYQKARCIDQRSSMHLSIECPSRATRYAMQCRERHGPTSQTEANSSSSIIQRLDISPQLPLPNITPNGHLHLIKRILHNIIRIKLINSLRNSIDIWLIRFREQQELGPRQCLKALQAEVFCFQHFYA